MISAEAPVLFAKACEIFILELTLRAWMHTEENKRRTLQRNDLAMAITKTDVFDFLIDIVPRDDIKGKRAGEDMRSMLVPQYYYHFAQQALAENLQASGEGQQHALASQPGFDLFCQQRLMQQQAALMQHLQMQQLQQMHNQDGDQDRDVDQQHLQIAPLQHSEDQQGLHEHLRRQGMEQDHQDMAQLRQHHLDQRKDQEEDNEEEEMHSEFDQNEEDDEEQQDEQQQQQARHVMWFTDDRQHG